MKMVSFPTDKNFCIFFISIFSELLHDMMHQKFELCMMNEFKTQNFSPYIHKMKSFIVELESIKANWITPSRWKSNKFHLFTPSVQMKYRAHSLSRETMSIRHVFEIAPTSFD